MDVDIELIPLSIASSGIPGIESPKLNNFGSFSAAMRTSYLRDPLMLYADNMDRGSIIAHRQKTEFGFSYDLSERFGFQLRIPTAVQWGSENPELSRSGVLFGDMSLGLKGFFKSWKGLDVGGRTEIHLPTSSNSAWMGEEVVRATALINIRAEMGPIAILAEAGPHLRPPINTEKDFIVGSEIIGNAGIKWRIWPDKFALGAAVYNRSGFVNFLKGGAENASEASTFIQWADDRFDSLQWQAGVARGLSDGYGTSEFRMFASLAWKKPPPQPAPVIVEELIPDPIVEEPPTIEPEEPAVWEEEELAKVEEDKITIRDDIKFKIGTDQILKTSLPTVAFIAGIINNDPIIGHVVIEGLASEEGTYIYNYELSNLRARAIYKALVNSGVHPDRLSHRGFGESLPMTKGEDEISLAKNRRVEFHIVRQDSKTGSSHEIRDVDLKPWDGTPLQTIKPAYQPETKEEESPENQFEEDDEEELIIPKSDPEKETTQEEVK